MAALALPQQLSLRLVTPDQHGAGLHPEPRHGTVLVWNQRAAGGRQWQKIEKADDIVAALAAHHGGKDRFISVNEFQRWRLVRLLRSLRAVYVDLDGCINVDYALKVIADLGLPSPTYMIHSGRGVHGYWLHDAVPAQALPVWQAVQNRIIETLKCGDVGVDEVAKDCTRVLRLAGTVNSKNNQEVVGYIVGGRWTLHELANEVLGERAPQPVRKPGRGPRVESLEAKRSMAQKVANATGIYRLWHSRYVDLCLIADDAAFLRPGGVPEGSRDKLLFCMSNALSWFAPADRIADEIGRISRTFTPSLSHREAMSSMSPIVKRAQQAADGQMMEWRGMKIDPRYRMRSETIREWVGPLITPEVESKLTVLCHPDRLAEREAGRQKGRDRVAEGRYSEARPTYEAKSQDLRAEVSRRLAMGERGKDIAAAIGISAARVSQIKKLNVRPSCIAAPAGSCGNP
jgi:hypothetical protein